MKRVEKDISIQFGVFGYGDMFDLVITVIWVFDGALAQYISEGSVGLFVVVDDDVLKESIV